MRSICTTKEYQFVRKRIHIFAALLNANFASLATWTLSGSCSYFSLVQRKEEHNSQIVLQFYSPRFSKTRVGAYEYISFF